MRNSKSKNMRKFLIAAMAVTMFPAVSSNSVYAQNGDWDELQNDVSSGGTVNLDSNYVADKASGDTTINVPAAGLTINGSDGVGGKYSISGYKDNATTGATAPQLINNTNATGGLTLNNVQLNQGGGNNGGAIGNTGTLNVSNSDFTNNTTIPPSGAGVTNSGNGGAIYNDQGTVNVSNSTFTGNGVYTDVNGDIIYTDEDGDPATPQDGGKPTVTVNGGAIYNAAPAASGDTTSNLTVNNNSKFENNYAANGGAIYNAGTAKVSNSVFQNNHAVVPSAGTTDGNHGRGGAIFNTASDNSPNLTISNTTFTGNTAEINSGAVYNSNAIVNITGSTFDGNSAQAVDGTYGSGGALGNYRGGTVNISDGTKFENNFAGNGGAIYTSSLELSSTGDFFETTLDIEDAEFNNNYSNNQGGAIWTYGDTAISNSQIHDNGISADGSVKTSAGGAIYNSGRLTASATEKPNGTLTVNYVNFENNFATDYGAAIANRGNGNVQNSQFINNGYSTVGGSNLVTGNGGAISNRAPVGSGVNNLSVNNAYFEGNVANNGGAVYNESTITIQNSQFVDNGKSSDGTVQSISGGALYNAANGTMNIVDSSFKGNVASSGGALYAASNSTTNISAVNQNVVFGDANNPNNNSVDTVVLNANAVANMNAAANRVIQFNSAVTGSAGDKSEININPTAGNTGLVEFNAAVSDADITLNRGTLRFARDKHLGASNDLTLMGGTLHMLNGEVNPIGAGNININGDTNLMLDVDIANKKMDSILSDSTNVNYTSGHINISHMHSISDSSEKNAKILFTDLAAISGNGVVTNTIENGIVSGPIYKYAVKQIYDDGVASGATPGEYFVFNQMGNSDNALIAPVAAQAGFLMMDNLYRQSFANMDMVMLMTREQREAMKHRNKYASTYDVTPGLYQPTIIPEERDGFWVRPFSNFENVPLSGGPRVSNVSYGALVGGDSDIIDIGHGWDATYSFFGAYHGSHQAYNGIGIWQNGGAIGGVGTLYKGNFFTGLTANVSASGVSANSAYGNEDFPMLMTGAAWKSGYNFEFGNGKFILQPSYMMSYTFVNVFNYTDAAGLNISNDPLNVIELIPGIKLIMNTKTGWQPYLGVNMTWNLMNKTKFYANDVALDRLSVDPFVEYGVGVQKRVGDRLTGFGQAMIRNGGRNGIALTMGWRWALGD